jgi:hypothetical protein
MMIFLAWCSCLSSFEQVLGQAAEGRHLITLRANQHDWSAAENCRIGQGALCSCTVVGVGAYGQEVVYVRACACGVWGGSVWVGGWGWGSDL